MPWSMVRADHACVDAWAVAGRLTRVRGDPRTGKLHGFESSNIEQWRCAEGGREAVSRRVARRSWRYTHCDGATRFLFSAPPPQGARYKSDKNTEVKHKAQARARAGFWSDLISFSNWPLKDETFAAPTPTLARVAAARRFCAYNV